MNKELEAKIEEEAEQYTKEQYPDHESEYSKNLEICESAYKAGTKSKALIEFLVPYVVELARKEKDWEFEAPEGKRISRYIEFSTEEILAKVWEEIK